MNVVIDYLTMTSKVQDERAFLQDLGLMDCNFVEMAGRFGWTTRLYYRGVSVYFGGSRDDVCLEVSGTGCRTVEELSGNTTGSRSFPASSRRSGRVKQMFPVWTSPGTTGTGF